MPRVHVRSAAGALGPVCVREPEALWGCPELPHICCLSAAERGEHKQQWWPQTRRRVVGWTLFGKYRKYFFKLLD